MSDRCEPPPELRERDGWHWVETPAKTRHIARWFSAHKPDIEPLWVSEHLAHATTGWAAKEWGWRYLAPVTPPAEVEALRAEVMRASTECADAMAQVVALRARVARLEWALEDLIDVQVLSTGWDNGVTDSTGTMNEGEYLHARAFDKALAALSAETP